MHWKVLVEPRFRLCRLAKDISDRGTASPAQISGEDIYFIFCWLEILNIKSLMRSLVETNVDLVVSEDLELKLT